MEVMQDAVDSTEVCIKIYARHRENDRSLIRPMNAAVLERVLITAGDYGIIKTIKNLNFQSPSSLQFSLSPCFFNLPPPQKKIVKKILKKLIRHEHQINGGFYELCKISLK